MKKIIFLLLGMSALSLWAEVSVLSVTDEDKHRTKEDFYHTYEYFVTSPTAQAKCQATRIAPRWFATAAHCVKDPCRKECTIRMDLMDSAVSALAQGEHSSKNATVFIHPGYREGTLVRDDFALIKLDVRKAPKTYYRRATKKNPQNVAMKETDFFAWLAKHPLAKKQYNKAINPTLPPLVDFTVSRNYEIDRKLSVISIFGGKRDVKQATNPVYYVHSLGYAYTTNFGIQKGMSGSGVMTNTGELMGIISSNVDENWYKDGKRVSHKEWFMFPVFNESILSFMQDTMGSDFNKMGHKDAIPSFVKKTQHNFSPVEQAMKKPTSKQNKK